MVECLEDVARTHGNMPAMQVVDEEAEEFLEVDHARRARVAVTEGGQAGAEDGYVWARVAHQLDDIGELRDGGYRAVGFLEGCEDEAEVLDGLGGQIFRDGYLQGGAEAGYVARFA